MEFHVKNSYIKGFLSKFKGQNELKVLKYISIIGINQILTSNKIVPSFTEIKKLAKSITKASAKEEKKIKTELRVIKDELSKLNEKFEEKMKALANKRTEAALTVNTEENYGSVNNIVSSPKTNYHDIEKRRNLTSEIKRHEKGFSEKKENNSNERINDIVKSRHSITPKPTEIAFPVVNPGLTRNTVTRHHLDDSQAKALLKEEGVVYFPKRKDSNQKETQASVTFPTETSEKPKSNAGIPKYPAQKSKYENVNEPPERDDESRNVQHYNSTVENRDSQSSAKSPHFPKSKEEIIQALVDQTKEDKENRNINSANSKPNSNQTSKGKENEKDQSKNKINSKPSLVEETKKMEKKILRDKSRRKNEIGRPANTLNLNYVESKIRDKVIKDRTLAKENGSSNTEVNEPVSKKNQDKFTFVENPNYIVQKSTENYYRHKYDNQNEENKLLESTTSAGQKSINIPNYSGGFANLTPPQVSTSRREAYHSNPRPEDSDRRYGEENANDNYLGMLDIANSFLNSPLMNQLSGFEKSSGISLKDSYHQGMKKNYSNSRVGTFDVKSSRDRKSPYYSETEDQRYQDSIHYQKYPEYQPGYRADFSKSNSYLKESGNRKYYPEPTKESRIFNREENSSLASSNFSNFLNDEMRGFYQKETLEANQPKYRKEYRPNSGENSSNISFNGNDTSHPDENTMLGRKSAQLTTLDISKNYASYDKNNVFKQERMSVSRVLNN